MKGYKAVGYAVLDRFGERLWNCTTRQACNDLIARMGWQDVIIVKTFRSIPKPLKPKVEVILSEEPEERASKTIIQAKHVTGAVLHFQSTKVAAQFFGCTAYAINVAITKHRYMSRGAMKDWKMTREEVECIGEIQNS